jgi:putative addiction module killer protein
MRIETTTEYGTWIDSLRDLVGRARIQARVERLAEGNPGQFRNLDGALSELKVDVGPGCRVYYTQRTNVLILLLCGGDKSTAERHSARAQTAQRIVNHDRQNHYAPL